MGGSQMYELRPVATTEEWASLHAIRSATLFAPGRHPGVVYDENHPDDRAAGHTPYLLLLDGAPIGVVRLDLHPDASAVVRLVAIVPARQRQGHGRELDRLVAEVARQASVRELKVNAAPDAVGFYRKTGWQVELWDASELIGLASDCVQMSKPL